MVRVGSWDIRAAASPATCGDAMLVPLRTAVSVLLLIPTLRTSTPEAKMSTSGPKLEKTAFLSAWSAAPTVIAPVADPGDVFAVSCYFGSVWVISYRLVTHVFIASCDNGNDTLCRELVDGSVHSRGFGSSERHVHNCALSLGISCNCVCVSYFSRCV